ncbi:hypothetical protein QVD17_00795 [Tagetes erecta]|uniref:Uncharacterized protein n=1 Tax=Tagetes erecta TaxID=13708 RepID=A0AAD8LC87_TARER|nr:hypothetical protein QVD17_00795 [Tagetes erecta]
MPVATASLSFTRFLSSFTKPHLTTTTTNHRSLTFSRRSLSLKSSKTTVTISVGDKLPDTTLSYFDSDNELQTTTISGLTGELKSKGVATIECIFVMEMGILQKRVGMKICEEVMVKELLYQR